MSRPSIGPSHSRVQSLVNADEVGSTPRLRNRANQRAKETGEYDPKADKELIKDIENGLREDIMGSIILNIVGLVETVFSPIAFKRLRGKHDPICLANDPKFPLHKDVPLDEPAADEIDTPKDTIPPEGGSAGENTAPGVASTSSARHGGNRRRDPELPKPAPCPVIDEIFKKLSTGRRKLYTNGMWSGWPDTSKPNMEGKVCEYLNKVLARVRRCLYGSEKGPEGSTEWVFSAKYANKMMKLEQVSRKPDIVVIPSNNTEAVRWRLVRSAGEVRSSRYQSERKLAEGRLAQYSRLMYGDDCARRFTLLFSLIKDEMALFRYDRAGVLGSKRFNVHEDPKNFLRVIVGLSLGEDFFVGLDPSFFFKGMTRFVRLNDREYEILETLHLHSVIRGRGTVALRVIIDPETRKEGVIKDQWVDKARHHQEFYWLLYLAKHGAKNIATLEDHQLVRFKIGEDTVVDETSALRSLISGWDMDGIETREHRRALVTPVGKLLKHFRSLKELVSVFKDFAEGILSVYQADVYHRDISRHNLVIVRKEGEEIGKGYVIDFDCAALVEHQRHGEAELTGTVPFMAISILKENGCPHRFHYELESLFYTLIWTCLTADGPRDDGCPEPTTEFRKTELPLWCGPKVDNPEDEDGVFKQIAGTKYQLMVSKKEFARRIRSHLSEYFNPIGDMLEELRDFLFRPETDKTPLTPEEEQQLRQMSAAIKRALGLGSESARVQDREAIGAMQSFIKILDKTLKKLETSNSEGMSSASASSNDRRAKDVTDDPETDEMERAACRRMRQIRGQKAPTTPEDDPIDEVEPKNDDEPADRAEAENVNDGGSEGETPSHLVSPSPRPMTGSHTVSPFNLDRQSQKFASSGSRTAVSRTTPTSISEFSKTAASLKAASLMDKDDTTYSGSSRRLGAPRDGAGQSVSLSWRDASSVRSKRDAPEPEQSYSSSKRRRR